MAKTFKLDIVTPERIVYSDEVVSLVAPAEEGYYGVLAGHAPFLGILKPGEVKIRSERGELHYATSGGFMEVTPKRTVILSESAEEVAAIDVRRAEESLQRAKERLAASGTKGADRERAEMAKARAENRLRVAKKYGRG